MTPPEAAGIQDGRKREAAGYAASLVEDGTVVGLGTGSTATYFIAALIERVPLGLTIACIPSSDRSAAQAREGGLTLTDFDTHPRIDLTVDGADEIERAHLALTKGLGGALLREKIVATASRRLIIIADETKLVDRLGSRASIPVEVVRFGWQTTSARLSGLGAARVTRREAGGTAPFLTDGGNLILDCAFPPIADPAALASRLKQVVGVVEHGLFVSMASLALVAGAGGVQRLSPR